MTSDRVCKNCDYGLYASTGCGFFPPDREKGCEHFKPKCDDKPICKRIAIKMTDLSKVSTADLIYELSKRKGIEQIIVEPYQEYELPIVEGPAIIYVVTD